MNTLRTFFALNLLGATLMVSAPRAVKAQTPNWDLTAGHGGLDGVGVYDFWFDVQQVFYGPGYLDVTSEDLTTGDFTGVANGVYITEGQVHGDSVFFGLPNVDFIGTVTRTGFSGYLENGQSFYGPWNASGSPIPVPEPTPSALLCGVGVVTFLLKRRARL